MPVVNKTQLKADLRAVVAKLKDDESIGVKGAILKLSKFDRYKGVDLTASKADIKELLIAIAKEQDGSSSSDSSSDSDSGEVDSDEDSGTASGSDDEEESEEEDDDSSSSESNEKSRKRKRAQLKEMNDVLKQLKASGITPESDFVDRPNKKRALGAIKRAQH